MFKKLLVANRGEIALRVMRSARELGIATVAVYSEADRDARHVAYADEAYLLGPAEPAQSYLNSERIIEVAAQAGADAIHPGYGFLAENAPFAQAVIAANIAWVGPTAEAIDAMGDKVQARRAMVAAGVPVVPGGTDPLADVAAAHEAAKRYGLPLAIKASGGGGGRGLKVAHTLEEIESAFTTAQREATAYFKNGTLYAERYLVNPKHVELQILADKHGTIVHVGERDCSLQRRHQKLVEEAPALISDRVRTELRKAGIAAAKAIGYDSVGTIECLVSGDEFFFLEMNTRIQVEHTITEMISGIDLVREQIRVAAGEPLGYGQDAIRFNGHAIEVRVNAEDPADGFRPAPGVITAYREPSGFGVRVDSAAHAGMAITPQYDSMIAKLIVWAPDRTQALHRLARCLRDYEIAGVLSTIGFVGALIHQPSVIDGTYGTATLEPFALTYAGTSNGKAGGAAQAPAAPASDAVRIEVNGKLFRVRFIDAPPGSTGSPSAAPRAPKRERKALGGSGNSIVTPMHGIVVELPLKAGDTVAEGQVVAVIEAMKMMNEIRAHRAGTIASMNAEVGATVEAQSALMTLEA